MNEWRREIGAIVVGLLAFLIFWLGMGWYPHIALIIGAVCFGLGYWLIPKPRPPRTDSEVVEEDLAESLNYASGVIRNIRQQLKIAKRPDMTKETEAVLAEAEGGIRYARSLGTADPINIGLLKTLLEATERGVTRAARVTGSSSSKALSTVEAFETKSLPELKNAMGQVNNALASGEVADLERYMTTISGTIAREGLTPDQYIPQQRST